MIGTEIVLIDSEVDEPGIELAFIDSSVDELEDGDDDDVNTPDDEDNRSSLESTNVLVEQRFLFENELSDSESVIDQ